MKLLSRCLLCDWVKEAWSSIPEETMKNSFRTCAITTNTERKQTTRNPLLVILMKKTKKNEACFDSNDSGITASYEE